MIRDKLLVFAFFGPVPSISFYFYRFYIQKRKQKKMSKNKIIIKLSSLKACDRESIVSLLAEQDQSKGTQSFIIVFHWLFTFILYICLFYFFLYFFTLVVNNVNVSFIQKRHLHPVHHQNFQTPPLQTRCLSWVLVYLWKPNTMIMHLLQVCVLWTKNENNKKTICICFLAY